MNQEAVLYPPDYWPISGESDIAVYVADLETKELIFLNKYARKRWGPEFRNRRCQEYLRSSDTESCPFCNVYNLVDASGKPRGVFRWEYHDREAGEWFDCSDEVVEWSDGRLVHMEIAVNITKRKKAEEKLEASETFNRSIIQNSSDCIKVVGLDGRLQYMNEAGRELLEIDDMDAYIGRSYEDFWAGSDKEKSKNAISTALKGGDGRFTGFAPTATGKSKWWDVIVTPVTGDGDGFTGLLIVSRDITQRKQAEDDLRKSRALLDEAQAYAHIGYWALEGDLQTVTWSDEAYRIAGLESRRPITFETIKQVVHPDDFPAMGASLAASMSKGVEHDIEYRIVRPDGAERWVSCKGIPQWDESGNVVRLSGFVQDITARKQSEESLRQALRDKEVLLREIHHRVKNNLQVVASLLYLQAMHADELTTTAALKESGRRIQLMAQVHERLYRSASLADVRMDEFITSLVKDMIDSYGLDADQVTLTTDMESISLQIDQAIPCSQIVSELVSNSLKHAFPDHRKGSIHISMSMDDGTVVLGIEDDGVGIPVGFEWQNTNSTGLQVVNALGRQLGGNIEAVGGMGTRFRISFLRD